MIITVVDETGTGRRIHQHTISIESERLTVRDLIAARVSEEVRLHNDKLAFQVNSLIQVDPTSAEAQLNGAPKGYRKLTVADTEKQTYLAWDAFQKNGFFILVNDRQATSLDEQLMLSKDTVVSFVRLTQLVGG